MIKTSSSQHDEYRLAFLRHLPKRIEAVERRIQRYRQDGWDTSGLSLLNDDVQRLAGASGRYDLVEPSQHLLALENMLGEFLARKTLPEPAQADRLLGLLSTITATLATHPETHEHGGNSEKAPEKYWQRWVSDAPPPGAVAEIPTAQAALASVPTAILLVKLLPKALEIPTPTQLQLAYAELRETNEALETRVLERTAELTTKNDALTNEIVERNRAEAALRLSEQRFRGFKESGIIGIILSDLDGNIKEANEAFLSMVGYTEADFLAGKVNGETLNTPDR